MTGHRRFCAAGPGRSPAVRGRGLAAIGLAAALWGNPVAAQEPTTPPSPRPDSAACADTGVLPVAHLSGPAAAFARLAEVVGRAPLHSRTLRRSAEAELATLCWTDDVPWRDRLRPEVRPTLTSIRQLPLRFNSELNTGFPIDRNNGELWAGRGWSAALAGGMVFQVARFSAGVQPTVTYQENRGYETVLTSVPGQFDDLYPGHVAQIDWPQRFGSTSYWRIYPGQSYVRADLEPVAFGVSTENVWWGPAQHYPILLSNTGPGFAHAFLRTTRPVDLWGVAELEAELLWGRLTESAYFDANAANDVRTLAGAAVVLRPSVVDGLWLGVARVRMAPVPAEGRGILDYAIEPFRVGDTEEGTAPLQLSTVFARWVLPAVRFEIYGEVALPDYQWGSTQGRGQDRGAAFMVGATKAYAFDRLLGGSWLRLQLEMVDLQNEFSLRSRRATRTYYVHDQVTQGYSHEGQLLGAAIGPGSEAQILAADLFWDWGSAGLFGERVGHDDDAYYALYAPAHGMHGHDVELALGLRQSVRYRGVDLSWSLRFAERRNRDFIPLGSGYWAERNTTLALNLTWAP